MKKFYLVVVTMAFFLACNEEVKVNEKDLEAAGKKLQKTVQKGVDTVGAKLKKIKNKIEEGSTDTLK